MIERQLFLAVFFLSSCTPSTLSSRHASSAASFPLQRTSANLPGHSAAGFFSLPRFDWPVSGQVLSKFGGFKGDVLNKGIDIQAPLGSAVHAVENGEVSFVSDEVKGFGRVIIIDHPDGYQTVYAHNDENQAALGQMVKRRQIIGRLGASGRAVTPYLHFEIRKNHKPVDPLLYLKQRD